ncbi:MAG: 16S rRNA (uracil(1498)-N(3))-methyltransferase [Opitutaceae bacterium]|nr:16S rRNA (uracil(1498)-N(3))-methyltransferase [Opitutaceae bacterium]
MNLILFTPEETTRPLPRTDARARHLLDVLQRRPGDTFDAGLRDGPRGKGTVVAVAADTIILNFTWGEVPPPPDPITLLIGLPRPQTARKILREATTLGVAALHFVQTDRGDAAYAASSLWTDGEWERHLVGGAEQAFCTRLPAVSHGLALATALAALPAGDHRLALDNYEAARPLSLAAPDTAGPLILAFGAERGWSAAERTRLRTAGFDLVHLGTRVLRLETAVIAALAVVKSRRGAM